MTEGVLRIDPPDYCSICEREVHPLDRRVVFRPDEIIHAACFLEANREV